MQFCRKYTVRVRNHIKLISLTYLSYVLQLFYQIIFNYIYKERFSGTIPSDKKLSSLNNICYLQIIYVCTNPILICDLAVLVI